MVSLTAMGIAKLFKEDVIAKAGLKGNEIPAPKTCVDVTLAVTYVTYRERPHTKRLCDDHKVA